MGHLVWAALVAFVCVCTTAAAQSHGDVRLFGGNSSSGRLEIYDLEQQGWVTFCNTSMNDNVATVVCRQLRYEPGTRASWTTVAREDQYGTPPVLARGDQYVSRPFRCSGTETALLQCALPTLPDCTDHSADVVVTCQGLADGDVRLFNGTGPFNGRVEMYDAATGSWGTVCDDDMDDNAAAVICRQVGDPAAGVNATWQTITDEQQYGPPPSNATQDDSIVFDAFRCTGTEIRFRDCGISFPLNENCRHAEDVAVTCASARPTPSPGRSPVSPSPSPLPPPANGALRLVGGNASSGRLEVYSTAQRRWGTVSGFASFSAEVACRQLGFGTAGVRYETVSSMEVLEGSTYGPAPADSPRCSIFLRDVYCTGTQRTGNKLTACTSAFPSPVGYSCDHGQDVVLTCGAGFAGYCVNPGGYFTNDTCRACESRCFQRGTCSLWAWNDSAVIRSEKTDRYGNGNGYAPCIAEGCRLYPNEQTTVTLRLMGNATTCSACRRSCKRNPLCKYFSWQGSARLSDLRDSDAACADGELRLVDGDGTFGRLQIYSVASGRWVAICAATFDKTAAMVACRQLNFSHATEDSVQISSRGNYRDPTYPFGPSPVDLPDVGTWNPAFLCRGVETRLTQCQAVQSIRVGEGLQDVVDHYISCGEYARHLTDVVLNCNTGPQPSEPPPPPTYGECCSCNNADGAQQAASVPSARRQVMAGREDDTEQRGHFRRYTSGTRRRSTVPDRLVERLRRW